MSVPLEPSSTGGVQGCIPPIDKARLEENERFYAALERWDEMKSKAKKDEAAHLISTGASVHQAEVTFGPLVETCLAHGISRTVAFELANDGTLETFKIGARRYVTMESMRALPGKMVKRHGRG